MRFSPVFCRKKKRPSRSAFLLQNTQNIKFCIFCIFPKFCSKNALHDMAWKCETPGVYSGFGPSKTKKVPKHAKESSFSAKCVQNAIRSIKTEVWRTHVAKTREKVHILDEKRFKCELGGGSRIKPRKTKRLSEKFTGRCGPKTAAHSQQTLTHRGNDDG